MAVAGGLDLHRGQLTFDYVDTGTGESWRGRISPADRESLRGWLRRFHGVPDVEFAVEGCTGWRYVVEELQRAGITPHLAEPACPHPPGRGRAGAGRPPETAAGPGAGPQDRHNFRRVVASKPL